MAEQPLKIFISGYPLDYNELALAQLVSPYGEVRTIKIVLDRQSMKPKGYSFIEMVSYKDALAVKSALDGLEIKDKTLTVNLVEEKPESPAIVYQKVPRVSGAPKTKRPRLRK